MGKQMMTEIINLLIIPLVWQKHKTISLHALGKEGDFPGCCSEIETEFSCP